MLPPSLQALKAAAQARYDAAAEKARQEAEARTAMNRDALRECIETTVSGDVLAAIGDIDLSEITASTQRYELHCLFPGHLPLMAMFARSSDPNLNWMRQEFSAPRSIWGVKRQGMTQHFVDLGEALLFAQHTPAEAAFEKGKSEAEKRLQDHNDAVPF